MPQTPHVESDVDPDNSPVRFRRVKIRCIPSLQLATFPRKYKAS